MLMASAMAAMTTSGCVGAVSRDEFRDELARRSLVGNDPARAAGDGRTTRDAELAPAGIAGAFPERAVLQVLDRTGSEDLEVRMMSFDLDTLVGTIEARDPDRPDEVDLYAFVDALLAVVEPVQLTEGTRSRFDEMAFRVSEVRFDDLDARLAEALEVFGDPDGRVTTLTWMAFLPGRTQLVVRVVNDRRAETIRFDLDGRITEEL